MTPIGLNAASAFGFNVIGHVSGNLGLGLSARNLIEVLLSGGFSVAVFDIDPGLGRWKYDTRYDRLTVDASEKLPFSINLVVLPPPTIPWVVMSNREVMLRPDRLNVACVWWELPVLPRHWRRALEFFDVLVAQSEFIRYMLDFSLSQTLTLSARHPLYLPEGITPCRQRYGISEGDIVFVTSFEAASDPVRKNAYAIVEAFKRGLHDFPNARLLVKVNNAQRTNGATPALAELQNASAQDSRIRLLCEPLSYREVLSLYASSDVFVSLHRSEGLGFGPMEAMALGKPVVATAWSGNMTYMDHTNACLVPYHLVPVAGSISAYAPKLLAGLNAVWAEPDVGEAAAWMRRLASDSALRARIGNRAAEAIQRFHAEATQAKFAWEIQAIWEHRSQLAVAPNRAQRMKDLQDATREWETNQLSVLARARRKGVETLNRHVLWRLQQR